MGRQDAMGQRVHTRQYAEDGVVRLLAKLDALTVDERAPRRRRNGKVTTFWAFPMTATGCVNSPCLAVAVGLSA